MANRHAAIGNSSGGGGRSMRDEDFDEEDVWAVVKDREDSSPIMRKSKDYSSGSSSSSSSSAWRLPTAPRGIRRGNNTPSHEAKLVQHSSAPMNIPDWSKIYRKNSRAMPWVDGVEDVNDAGNTHQICVVDDDDDDDGDDDIVPPHEWIARKLASSQISSFSVCEGVGRTLKGRELSKVRNAVLTKTGFLE